MRSTILPLIIFLFLLGNIHAQKIDNTASFRNMKGDTYFRVHYDNDYFAATDKNYTQGYNLELVAPGLKANPVNKLFYRSGEKEMQYGLSIEHIGFTPKNIKSAEIQQGDRPFAAAIMLKSFTVATDIPKTFRFISAFSAGIIGPGAFGKEMQVGIHRATGNVIPQGWQYQIKNDVVLNYELGFEKQLIQYGRFLSLNTNATAKVGTLFTNASVGFNAMVGVVDSPFTSATQKERFQIYFYTQPLVKVVAYDATLQGGIFNDRSPYTISSGNIERITGEVNYGIVLKTRSLYLEYSRSSLTREFASGSSANWGGIRIGFRI